MFASIINGLEMVFSYLAVAEVTYNHIIIIAGAALNSLIVGNTENIIIGVRRYLIIKKTLFLFRKKFATTGNRRRYCGYRK